MKKPTLAVIVAIILAVIVGIVMIVNKNKSSEPTLVDDTEVDLPINTIPVAERPFITLSPDSTGRSLDISLSGAPTEGELEYEMIYNAAGKQEGALGSIFLSSEKQPIVKSILLGSKSGGGKVTYHEGVTGGSITVTYNNNRLKESWNYLHFDPADPSISSSDARFSVMMPKTGLKKDAVIITMKTFGYEKTGLPESAKVVSGPYGYFPETSVKGSSTVSLKLPAGEYINPTMYAWDGKSWAKVVTKTEKDTLTASSTSTVFLVTAD